MEAASQLGARLSVVASSVPACAGAGEGGADEVRVGEAGVGEVGAAIVVEFCPAGTGTEGGTVLGVCTAEG